LYAPVVSTWCRCIGSSAMHDGDNAPMGNKQHTLSWASGSGKGRAFRECAWALSSKRVWGMQCAL